MTDYTRIHDKFEYHLKDTDCSDCLHYVRKNKATGRGCDRDECCCEDIRADAIANGRIKRPRGWFRRDS